MISGGGNGGPYYFTWDNGFSTQSSLTFIASQTATYTVIVTDSCSTPRSYSKNIIVNPLPEPGFDILPASATILNPYFEFRDLSVNTGSWQWNFGDNTSSSETNPVHNYQHPGYYTVQLIATSDKGCVDSTERIINVENVVIFYIPNSFSPNNDGHNDLFGITGYSVSGYDLSVFNRWGQRVFVSDTSFDLWDGNDRDGKPVPDHRA